jgi:hypothetical protein
MAGRMCYESSSGGDWVDDEAETSFTRNEVVAVEFVGPSQEACSY